MDPRWAGAFYVMPIGPRGFVIPMRIYKVVLKFFKMVRIPPTGLGLYILSCGRTDASLLMRVAHPCECSPVISEQPHAASES